MRVSFLLCSQIIRHVDFVFVVVVVVVVVVPQLNLINKNTAKLYKYNTN